MKKLIKTENFNFYINNDHLEFEDDVEIGATKAKKTDEMHHLLYKSNNDKDWNYIFANGCYKENDFEMYQEMQLSNGITVINKGLINHECRKNSGHYHGIVEGQAIPRPEVYEVITGTAAFLIQESHNFDKDEELKVDSFKMCIVKQGEKIIVPAYCAHCCVNIGEDIMAFYNLAGVSPLHYEPIVEKRGFAYYILKNEGILCAIQNNHYSNLPLLEIVRPHEAPNLGIVFDQSLYDSFKQQPELYGYLNDPENYDEIKKLMR